MKCKLTGHLEKPKHMTGAALEEPEDALATGLARLMTHSETEIM